MLMFIERLGELIWGCAHLFTIWQVWAMFALCAGIITTQRGGWTHLWRSSHWALVFAAGLLSVFVFGALFGGQSIANSWFEYAFVALLIANATAAIAFVVVAGEWRLTRLAVHLPWTTLVVVACVFSVVPAKL